MKILSLALALLLLSAFLPASAAEPPSAAAIKDCLGKTGNSECLDLLFRAGLEKHSPAEMLQSIQKYGDADPALRVSCHPVVHALGREIFRLKGNVHDSFMACDQTCHSGCYHGAVERFLRGDSAHLARHVSQSEIAAKAAAACDSKAPLRVYFQCLHGLGHALMYFTENEIEKSVQTCDSLPDEWSREACYGGVFMENVFSTNPEKRNISATDYHHPCNQMAAKYRGACYLIQTWRMQEMGLTTERLFQECAKAGPYEEQCAQSVGRDLSNAARGGDSNLAAEECARAGGEARRACIRGVAYALIDNTWDSKYAAPFCSALRSEDAAYCDQESKNYLRMFVDK
jgi:hypothetical protein